jgi:hypothetical protein
MLRANKEVEEKAVTVTNEEKQKSSTVKLRTNILYDKLDPFVTLFNVGLNLWI